MKKLNILYFVLFFAFLLSCEDDYDAPNSFSDVSWYSVVHDKFDDYPIIGQGDYFSISDISQGVIDHRWELLDSGIYFLRGPIVRNDTTLEEKIIGGGKAGDISTDKTVHLYFPNGGIQSVRLYNTFDDEVSFIAEDTVFTSVYDEELGLHVFDHVFTVDVYYDVVASYKVYDQNGDSIDFTAADTIRLDIQAGDKLHFVQTVDSMYHITDVTWTLPKGSPNSSNEDSVAVTFYTPGQIKGFKLRANRSGQNIPASSQTVTIPLIVNVGQSEEDFTIVSVEKENATSLVVQLSGQALTLLSKEDFTVTAENADLGQNFPIDVEKITMLENNTQVRLTLMEPIYSNDKVIINYTGSDVKSSDNRTIVPGEAILEPITDLSVVDQDFFGFESGTDIWVNSSTTPGEYDFVPDPAGGAGNCVKISVNKSTTVFLDSPASVALQAGTTYRISYKLYLDSRDHLRNGFNLRFVPEGGEFNDANALISGWMAYGNVNHFKEGEWVSHYYDVVPNVTGNYWLHIRVGTGDSDEYGTFYIDDINVEVVDFRPAP